VNSRNCHRFERLLWRSLRIERRSCPGQGAPAAGTAASGKVRGAHVRQDLSTAEGKLASAELQSVCARQTETGEL